MATHGINHALDPQTIQILRQGQAMASTFVAKSLALLTKSHPELWINDDFLLILGMAYEHLALGRAAAPGEYFRLTKALVDSGRLDSPDRKAEKQERKPSEEESLRKSNKEELGAEVKRLMRQVYGVDLQFNNEDAPPVGHARMNPKDETKSRESDNRPEP